MATRKAAIFVAAVVLLTVIPIAVIAGGGTGLDSQATIQADPGQTSSETFRNVPGLGNVQICTSFARMSVLASLTLAGGPVEVRVLIDGASTDAGIAQFDPSATSKSFSYGFFEFEPGDGAHDVDVQWRSRNGDQVVLKRGNAIYLHESAPC